MCLLYSKKKSCALLQERQDFGRNLLLMFQLTEVLRALHLATYNAERYDIYSYTPGSTFQTDKCNIGSSLNVADFSVGPAQQSGAGR